MIDLLVTIGAAVAAVALAWIGGQRKGRRDEHRDAINEAMRDEQQRMQDGRDAVRDGRDDGGDPDDRVRANDGLW